MKNKNKDNINHKFPSKDLIYYAIQNNKDGYLLLISTALKIHKDYRNIIKHPYIAMLITKKILFESIKNIPFSQREVVVQFYSINKTEIYTEVSHLIDTKEKIKNFSY